MTEQVAANQNFHRDWTRSSLSVNLAGDVASAFLSATLISPILTAIDRAVVENVAFANRPLKAALKENIACIWRHPRQFFMTKPFFCMWTLYAATYTTANSANSLTNALMDRSQEVFMNSITFIATCAINVPLGVWKDISFVQTFGVSSMASTGSVSVPLTTKSRPPARSPTRFPGAVGATFLARDAITILGSFNLPPMVSESLPMADVATRMAAAQLLVPVLSQIVATPIHLLGLDLYSNPHKDQGKERRKRIQNSLPGATAVRCARIIPAFGVGGIVNTSLRAWFHARAEYMREEPSYDKTQRP